MYAKNCHRTTTTAKQAEQKKINGGVYRCQFEEWQGHTGYRRAIAVVIVDDSCELTK